MGDLEYDGGLMRPFGLTSSMFDSHMARSLADITINWGRVEYCFYVILNSIDWQDNARWRDIFRDGLI